MRGQNTKLQKSAIERKLTEKAMDKSEKSYPHTYSVRMIKDLGDGDHLCCLYETEEEHRAILTPFVRQGLERGEKVVYIVDAHTAETVLAYLRDDGVGADPFLARGQLTILGSDDAYMQEGIFDPERMIALLRAETDGALAQGYSALRVTAEMTWALRGLPGSEKLIEYEAKLNEFFPGSKCLAVCQYDRRRFDCAVLLEVLRTHPVAVIGTTVYDNFYYIPPTELLGRDLSAAELEHCILNLAKRKQMEEALRESEEFSFGLLNNSPNPIIVINPDTSIRYVNPALEELTGFCPEELVGRKSPYLYWTEETLPKTDMEFREALCKGARKVEDLFKKKNGERFWVEVTSTPVVSDGEFKYYLANWVDITERKRAERAVQEARKYAENIVETVREPLVVLDAEPRVISANYSFYQTFGVTPDETEGQLFYDLGNRQWDIPRLRELLGEIILKDAHFQDFEVEHDFPTIGSKTMLLSARRIKQAGGRAHLILLAIEDITVHKQAEEELKKYSEKLEGMVKERTKELQEAQQELIRKEKLAVLGRLAGGISHELRNPLGAIKNAAYFLSIALGDPEPKVRETLEILEKEVTASERIISSLLDFARPKPPIRRKVDINDIVQEALSRAAVQDNIQVVCQLDGAVSTILADPDQVGQIFGNIITNAIQAMPEGGWLTVKTSESSDLGEPGRAVELSETHSSRWVAVSFTDTGVGIPEENLGKLFEPLFTTKAKGIGFGLALVKTLVEGNDGTIEVESEIGRGSTFRVRLPAR